jgi:hypothetical protein
VLEDIDRILERIEDNSGFSRPGPPPLISRKHVLYVEHRYSFAPYHTRRTLFEKMKKKVYCLYLKVVK